MPLNSIATSFASVSSDETDDSLTKMLQAGARQLLAQAVELKAFLAEQAGLKAVGRRRLDMTAVTEPPDPNNHKWHCDTGKSALSLDESLQ